MVIFTFRYALWAAILLVIGSTSFAQTSAGRYTSVSAGACHTCALTDDGRAMCWGNNAMAQIGLGGEIVRNALPGCLTRREDQERNQSTRQIYGVKVPPVLKPSTVVGINNVKAIAAGYEHTCAKDANDNVLCWGKDTANKENMLPVNSSKPVPVRQLGAVQTVVPGALHNCAVTADARVSCWSSIACQSACGETEGPKGAPANHAKQLLLLEGAAGLALVHFHSCAFSTQGDVACWGANEGGQMGVSDKVQYSYKPLRVRGLGQVTALAGKEEHNCALQVEGQISCWGSNSSGELGDGQESYKPDEKNNTPKLVVGLPGPASAIAAGGQHYCALLRDATVACWGNNSEGQLGAEQPKRSSKPIKVAQLSNVTALSLGLYHSCALKTDKTIVCWGSNVHGQLGNGTLIDRTSPAMVIN
jgi:alpha-tubulin suppressor-like RCC1 family protein